MVPQPPSISAEIRSRLGECDILGCTALPGVFFQLADISKSLYPALFGWDKETTRISVRLCQKHYRSVRNKDGIEWGYRSRDGVIERYIKNWWY